MSRPRQRRRFRRGRAPKRAEVTHFYARRSPAEPFAEEDTGRVVPGCADEEASYVWVASGLSEDRQDRLPLSVQRASAVVEWLSERRDGEDAARVLSEAIAEGRAAMFSVEQRAVIFDELHERRKRWPLDFDLGLTQLYFELLIEFGEFGRSNRESV